MSKLLERCVDMSVKISYPDKSCWACQWLSSAREVTIVDEPHRMYYCSRHKAKVVDRLHSSYSLGENQVSLCDRLNELEMARIENKVW